MNLSTPGNYWARNIVSLYLVLITSCVGLLSSCSTDFESPEEISSKNLSTEIHTRGFQPLDNTTAIQIKFTDTKPISPFLYGVNNDWRQISNERYFRFSQALEEINYTLVRFPGGWESEYYDWSENSTPNWINKPSVPGASIQTVKSSSWNAISIVVPTVSAMNLPQWSAEWYAAIQNLKQEAEDAITLTGSENIKTIEIGNEWWLQWGGGVSRYNKVRKYAHIARRIAAHIRTTFPEAKFNLVVNGDYTSPKEFSAIKYIFEASGELDLIDGLALHTYTGYNTETHNINDLQQNITECISNLGKSYLSLSEWAPSKAYNNNKIYAQGANLIVEQIFEHARAGANEAAFWPPTNNSIPGLGLFNYGLSQALPTAQLFGDMAGEFHGRVLKTENKTIRAAAAQNEDGVIVVYVTGKDYPGTTVTLDLGEVKIDEVLSAELWEPGDLNDSEKPIPMTKTINPPFIKMGKRISFNINERTDYSIYKIKFKLKE